MKLEQQIFNCIVNHVGGKQKDVKGVTGAQLTRMKKGVSGVSTRKIKDILKANGMTGTLIIYGNGVKTTINFFD